MGNKETYNFRGNTERSRLLKLVAEGSPIGFKVGSEILKAGGITAKSGLSIERTKAGDIGVVERTFDTSMLAHNEGVCWAANGLAELVGLRSEVP